MVKRYGCAGILLFAIGLFPLMAQDNTVPKEMAIKIADRIVALVSNIIFTVFNESRNKSLELIQVFCPMI